MHLPHRPEIPWAPDAGDVLNSRVLCLRGSVPLGQQLWQYGDHIKSQLAAALA